MKEPIWLQKAVVIAVHQILLVEHGGPAGLRDEGLLESALGRLINQYHYEEFSNVFDLASAYGMGIMQNHPFVDGNKRTAFVAAKTFLMRNGYGLLFPKEEAVRTFFSAAAGKVSGQQLADAFAKYSIAIPQSDVVTF